MLPGRYGPLRASSFRLRVTVIEYFLIGYRKYTPDYLLLLDLLELDEIIR